MGAICFWAADGGAGLRLAKLRERRNYRDGNKAEGWHKYSDSAGNGLQKARALPVDFPFEKIAQMALVSHDTEAEQGWWVSKTEGIAFKLASLCGAALTLDS